MTNQEILKKAITKAEANGWKCYLPTVIDKNGKWQYDLTITKYVPFILFDHAFAKALWGTEIGNCTKPAWQFHLQMMVLEENPIRYLAPFV